MLETTGNGPKGIEMHSAHVIYTRIDLKNRKNKKNEKKKKNKMQKAKLVDINFGQFPEGLETTEQQQQDEQELGVKPNVAQQGQQLILNKVNIEFDEQNAIIEDGDGDDEILDIQEEEQKYYEEKESVLPECGYLIVIGGRYFDKILDTVYAIHLETL